MVLVSEWSKVGGGWAQEKDVVMFMPQVFVGGIPFLGMRGMLRFVQTALCEF